MNDSKLYSNNTFKLNKRLSKNVIERSKRGGYDPNDFLRVLVFKAFEKIDPMWIPIMDDVGYRNINLVTAASYSGLSVNTLRDDIRSGMLPAKKLMGTYSINGADLLKYYKLKSVIKHTKPEFIENLLEDAGVRFNQLGGLDA